MIDPLLEPDCDLTEKDGTLALRSRRFDDIYYSGADGLAETRLVFLDGNNISERLRKCRHFTIAETGFGTGLNFLAMLAEIKAMGLGAPYLHFISTEIAPLNAQMIDTVLAPWPELAEFRSALINDLPPRWPGRHRRHFLDGRVTLDLLYGDSMAMLAECSFKADAWFLDGFTPSRNPLMWDDTLFQLMATRTMPGGSLASFTAAGNVRRGLEKAGFTVTRHPGFSGKRHRITGEYKKTVSPEQDHPIKAGQHDGRVVVLGAGIAGASVAASLMRYGVKPLVIGSSASIADGASGNISAVQAPRLTATDTPEARLSLTAWGYARYRARVTGSTISDATVLLAHSERETLRQQKISALGWPHDVFTLADNADTSAVIGVETDLGGMLFANGGTVDPVWFVTENLASAELCLNTRIDRMEQHEDGIVLFHDNGQIKAETVVLAAGPGMVQLAEPFLKDCPFQVTAGHVSHLDGDVVNLNSGVSFGGYMARARNGMIALGASFDHHDPSQPMPDLTTQNHQANLDLLPAQMKDIVSANLNDLNDLSGRTSLRLASPDRHPLAGQLAKGIYTLTGLGARGMVTAPILGEYIASLILGVPSPLDTAMSEVVDPDRFRARAARRQLGPSRRPSAE